jgi:hypothetical protein
VLAGAIVLTVLAGAWQTGAAGGTAVAVDAVLGLVFPVLGTFILARRGPARVAVLCLISALGALAFAGDAYAQLPGSPAGAAWGAWLGTWAWAPAVLTPVTLLILLVPDGEPPGPRWRPLQVVATAVIVAFTAVLAVSPQERLGHPNPAAVDALAGAEQVFGLLVGALALVTVGCAAALVRRLVSASGRVRLQLAWVATGAVVFAATTFGNAALPAPVAGAVEVAGALAFPLAVAVAMLWHRLYDTDPVLRRGLVYGLCAVVLTVTYVVVVAGAGALLSDRGAVPAAVAAAVTALAISPVRRLLGRVVDRALYGHRGDPYAVLVWLDRRLTGSAGPQETLAAVAESATRALRLPYAVVELGDADAPLLRVPTGCRRPPARRQPGCGARR